MTKNDSLQIDYDTDLMVARFTNSTDYEFSKIYTYKEQFFSYDLGAWNRYKGLMNVPQGSFYSPVFDLNGTELVAAVEEVRITGLRIYDISSFLY